ncbi:MAG: hypothetical protein IJZ64_01745 [Ruminococcus sp.]|nr:hypothetical protein [Ruminococcus sp.]
MIEQDTVRLLRECDAGIKMGISAIDEVLDYTSDTNLKNKLVDSKDKHIQLKSEMQGLLHKYHDDGKDPTLMAKGMSWVKTNVKLTIDNSDSAIADLITDGCNMGVKNLEKYLNQYQMANEKSKNITKKLINLEQNLALDIKKYL